MTGDRQDRVPHPNPGFAPGPHSPIPPEFFEAHIRAEWEDWTFGANQAARRAAEAENLVTLRRQYPHLSDQDRAELAASWRSDGASGPYFDFAASESEYEDARLISAPFAAALHHELGDETPEALTALIERWLEQRHQALQSGLRRVEVPPPRVTLLLPGAVPPPQAWRDLAALDLEAPEFDKALLHWDDARAAWLARPAV
jgi:hypothetical protein